jgi:hypothetical protein
MHSKPFVVNGNRLALVQKQDDTQCNPQGDGRISEPVAKSPALTDEGECNTHIPSPKPQTLRPNYASQVMSVRCHCHFYDLSAVRFVYRYGIL